MNEILDVVVIGAGQASLGISYFLGFPWLHTRKSGILYGVEEDAAYLAEVIENRLA